MGRVVLLAVTNGLLFGAHRVLFAPDTRIRLTRVRKLEHLPLAIRTLPDLGTRRKALVNLSR